MGKDKFFRMDLLDEMENHFHGSIIVPRDSDIISCMCQHDQTQITGTVDDMKKPGIIQVTPLIGRVQLDPDKPLLFSETQLIRVSIKIRMNAGKRQNPHILVKSPVSVQAVIYLMDLERRCHDRQVDAKIYACLSHGSGQAGCRTVGIRRNICRSGKNFKRARRYTVRKNM